MSDADVGINMTHEKLPDFLLNLSIERYLHGLERIPKHRPRRLAPLPQSSQLMKDRAVVDQAAILSVTEVTTRQVELHNKLVPLPSPSWPHSRHSAPVIAPIPSPAFATSEDRRSQAVPVEEDDLPLMQFASAPYLDLDQVRLATTQSSVGSGPSIAPSISAHTNDRVVSAPVRDVEPTTGLKSHVRNLDQPSVEDLGVELLNRTSLKRSKAPQKRQTKRRLPLGELTFELRTQDPTYDASPPSTPDESEEDPVIDSEAENRPNTLRTSLKQPELTRVRPISAIGKNLKSVITPKLGSTPKITSRTCTPVRSHALRRKIKTSTGDGFCGSERMLPPKSVPAKKFRSTTTIFTGVLQFHVEPVTYRPSSSPRTQQSQQDFVKKDISPRRADSSMGSLPSHGYAIYREPSHTLTEPLHVSKTEQLGVLARPAQHVKQSQIRRTETIDTETRDELASVFIPTSKITEYSEDDESGNEAFPEADGKDEYIEGNADERSDNNSESEDSEMESNLGAEDLEKTRTPSSGHQDSQSRSESASDEDPTRNDMKKAFAPPSHLRSTTRDEIEVDDMISEADFNELESPAYTYRKPSSHQDEEIEDNYEKSPSPPPRSVSELQFRRNGVGAYVPNQIQLSQAYVGVESTPSRAVQGPADTHRQSAPAQDKSLKAITRRASIRHRSVTTGQSKAEVLTNDNDNNHDELLDTSGLIRGANLHTPTYFAAAIHQLNEPINAIHSCIPSQRFALPGKTSQHVHAVTSHISRLRGTHHDNDILTSPAAYTRPFTPPVRATNVPRSQIQYSGPLTGLARPARQSSRGSRTTPAGLQQVSMEMLPALNLRPNFMMRD